MKKVKTIPFALSDLQTTENRVYNFPEENNAYIIEMLEKNCKKIQNISTDVKLTQKMSSRAIGLQSILKMFLGHFDSHSFDSFVKECESILTHYVPTAYLYDTSKREIKKFSAKYGIYPSQLLIDLLTENKHLIIKKS